MASLKASSSRSSLSSSSPSHTPYIPPSPPTSSLGSSASSSKISLEMADEENITITASTSKKLGKRKSQEEDLRLLAISTHMTELSYSISDIQTRIFEIQELRHKSQLPGDNANTTSIIDQSLMSLDERLEAVSKGIKSVNESLEPLLQSAPTPTLAQNGDLKDENAVILRKHATLMQEWEAVQDESDVLREELKEDKWLTVFRTVTDQADGMMSSLEKAVNRCQEFIWQVHRRGAEDSLGLTSSQRSDKPPMTISIDVFNSLLDSYEAKKKHYMPATSKVLSIIDKGVRDRVTKNGETLRRHAESAQRWKNLRERISRTDTEMETVRKILLQGDTAPSENGSSASGHTSHSRYLATPPGGSRGSRAPSSSSTISRSISPFRKFARKITGSSRQSPSQPVTPLHIEKNNPRAPASEPVKVIRRQRTSVFGLRNIQPTTPSTPDRPGHKYSQSLTPDPSPRVTKIVDAGSNYSTLKGRPTPPKQRWNSSTKIESEDKTLTVKATPPKRAPSSTGVYGQSGDDIPPVPPLGSSYRRSLSRTSMASSRPWSPVTSSYSTSQSSHPPMPTFRPPSRSQTPSHNVGRAVTPGLTTTPRPRPKTPSYIPAPAKWRSFSSGQSEGGWDDNDYSTTLSQRAFSPAFSTSGASNSSPSRVYPRPPSRSMIPIPSVQLSSPSRPGSAMSRYASEDPSMSTSSAFRASAMRAQTPEAAVRARAQQVPIYQSSAPRASRTPSTQSKAPPSSYRDGSSSTSRAPSRSGSRMGAYTPNFDQSPVHEYVPSNPKDPLDMEVAAIANSIPHGLLVERVDPPLRTIPKEGEEIKAQYAFSNALSRKLVTCKLTTLTRSGKGASGDVTTKKVMCRVGGGWQDLQLYILNRQAGM